MGRQAKLRECLPSLGHILSRFRPYIRKQRGLIAGSLASLFLGVGLRLLEPWPLKIVFDRVIGVQKSDAIAKIPAIDSLQPTTLLLLAAIGVVVIIALRAVAAYGYAVGFALVSNRVLAEVREQVYRHLQGLSLRFHARAKSGDLIIRVIGDVKSAQGRCHDGRLAAATLVEDGTPAEWMIARGRYAALYRLQVGVPRNHDSPSGYLNS